MLVYLEADGHGTVSYSETTKELKKTINQTVGDAPSDMLVTIAVLKLGAIRLDV